jgi:hypothetical protein
MLQCSPLRGRGVAGALILPQAVGCFEEDVAEYFIGEKRRRCPFTVGHARRLEQRQQAGLVTDKRRRCSEQLRTELATYTTRNIRASTMLS